jgi:uncharacterized NAD-dependent epimerase/dehydratase family protein
MTKSNALIITAGYLDRVNGKTAHGLLRGTDRFRIVGVIDEKYAGRDAGEVLDGKRRNIPVYASLAEFKAKSAKPAEYCIVGVATKGGVLPEEILSVLREALRSGIGIVNGLHDCVSDHPDLMELASRHGADVIDVRRPKPFHELHFWTGRIKEVRCLKVAVLGTDCALGKRTTAWLLTTAMQNAGRRAEMIYTGQTGWMQGAKYGFIFDATVNDFISGEMEDAIVRCWEEARPEIMFIEGQSSLRNPTGPAGSEWILSAAAQEVVLQHDPARKFIRGAEEYGAAIGKLKDEIALITMYGASTVAVTINTSQMAASEAKLYAEEQERELGIPVVLPLEEGVERLVPVFSRLIDERCPA